MSADERPASGPQEFTRWLAGSERPRPASHKHLEALHPDEAVAFTLVLRRKPGSPPLPRVPLENQPYIAREEYENIYGADPAEVEAAAAFVQAEGMTVLEAHPGCRTLSLLGTATQVHSVFGVALQHYEDAGAMEILAPIGAIRSHRGFDGAVYLPAELAACVTAVVGLDDRFLGVLRGTAANEAAGTGSPSVSTVAQKLKIPNTGAYGEIIGVFAAQPPRLPGTPPCYLPSDITHLYFAGQPAGYRTRPLSITDINLTVGTTTYKNDPSQITNIASLADADNAVLELTQDIATCATVAQGARLNVYFTEASEQGYLAFMNRVLFPGREKQPTVLSFSLAMDEGSDSKNASGRAGAGAARGSGSLAYLVHELFHQIAALGISVFIAVGERGTEKWRLLAAPNLAPPVAVSRLPHGSHNPAQTSGTIATALSTASWQIAAQAAGDPALIAAGARGILEISSEAAYSGFFVNAIPYSYAGASCVASFYAGTTALLRSAFGAGLGFLNSMLHQLRKTQVPHNNSKGDDDSRDVSGSVADESDPVDKDATDVQFLVSDRAMARRRIRNWDTTIPMTGCL